MSKVSKKLVIIIIILLVATFGLLYNKVSIHSFLTDSGFDYSYDSGGGSSWDSGSSWDYDSGSSYGHDSSSSYSGDGDSLGGGFIFFIFIVILILIALSNNKDNKNNNSNYKYPLMLNKNKAWDNLKFEEVIRGITLEKFISNRINDLIQVQYNWMNFNYNGLREQLTDELYNQYEMQLKTLEIKGQRNVMSNFKSIDSMVTNVTNINGRYTVTMEVIMSFVDYIEANGKIVRGNNINPGTIHYELVFTSTSKEVITKCPKCGGELKDTTSQVCPYCRTTITQDSTKWVMSKKISRGQR